MQHEDRPKITWHPAPRCLKVTFQDFSLVDSLIVEEAISRFRVRSVLARKRNAPTRVRTELLEDHPETLVKALVLELTAAQLLINPTAPSLPVGLRSLPTVLTLDWHTPPCDETSGRVVVPTLTRECTNHLEAPSSGPNLWVIERLAERLPSIDEGHGAYPIESGIDDMVVDYYLEKLGFWQSTFLTDPRSGLGRGLLRAISHFGRG